MNKDKKTVAILASILAVVVVIAIIVMMPKNNNGPANIPGKSDNVSGIKDVDGGNGLVLPPLEDLEDDDNVTDWMYMTYMTDGSEITLNKSRALSTLYRTNDVFRAYSTFLGTEFVSNLSTRDTNGNEFVMPREYNKVIVFLNVEDDTDYAKITDYMYIGAMAQEANAYSVTVINTNSDTFVDYLDTFDGFVLGEKTEEVFYFLKNFPDNVVFFVDENNIIEAVTDFGDVNEMSMNAARIFSGNTPSYQLMSLFKEYHDDVELAVETYGNGDINNKHSYQTVESIEEVNMSKSTEFLYFDNGDFLNDANAEVKEIVFVDNRYIVMNYTVSKSNRTYTILQSTSLSDVAKNDEYYNYSSAENSNFNIIRYYGNSKDEIYCFTLNLLGMNVLFESNEPWTMEEVSGIIAGFA